ncbi:MAG: hypothetical protein ABT15_31615 [Pseudonocardia sp. SCN 73-27]|nr:MAG: hypothetical protein ABT15_31615 [Pseudonocardia sp. SCN 73-27]
MMDVLADVLYVPATEIDTEKPLDQLGLDSILGVELTAILRKRIGVDLSLEDVREANTAAGLIDRVRRTQVSDAGR